MDFLNAFKVIEEIVHLGNGNLSKREFWKLAGGEKSAETDILQDIIYITFEVARIASALLEVYCPSLVEDVRQ